MTAIVAKRVDAGTADLSEIRKLASAAGYTVLGSVTQTRREDPAYAFGEGKVAEIASEVERTEATTIIIDNRLGPYQTFNIGQAVPEGTSVIDRFTLILEIFAQRANTRKAQLQVELAELRYELPRASAKASLAKRHEHPGFMGLGEYDESRERDIKARISRITEELDQIAEDEAKWRARRRESGFDLVALAGYTNAGKSTLLRRLAEEIDVDENDKLHPDLDPTAESRDQLFTTLGTTTRRAILDDREVLVTDTVGFIRDLPHWLVESFRSTLDGVYLADLVLLVVDISEPVEEVREKLVTCHETLFERNEAPILTVFNKVDQVDDETLRSREEALRDLAPDPVKISARDGIGIDSLRRRIAAELPALTAERLVLPLGEDTMSLISWIHDNATVDDVTYGDESAVIAFRGQTPTVERARSRAAELSVTAAD